MATIHYIVPKQFKLFVANYTFVVIWLVTVLCNIVAWNLIKFIKIPGGEVYALKYSVIFGITWIDSIDKLYWIVSSGIIVGVFNLVCTYFSITKYRLLAVWWAVGALLYNFLLVVYMYILTRIQ